MKCTNCGSLAIDYADNQAVCSQCGVVLEESQIVSDITFGENSAGGAVVQGSMIAADQSRARVSGPGGFRGGYVSESREVTIATARGAINNMATALRVPTHVADRALRFFTLALDGGAAAASGQEPKNYVLGRKAEYTTASCLYVACRMEKTTHMLIDFADAIQVNVFILGRSYLKLVRVLNLRIPLIDPSIYISRFAALLDFGDETQRVAYDASRLVSRFQKDWITEGRRPAGICGACLLLAARMNHFRRSISEVIQVVKIADVTLRNRLEDFKKTPSGQLTVQDFRAVWLEEEMAPPSFSRAREPMKQKKRKAKKKIKTDVDVENGAEADIEAEAPVDAPPEPEADADGEGEQEEEVPIDPALESLVDQAAEDEINAYLQEGIARELDKTLQAQEAARIERARQGRVGGAADVPASDSGELVIPDAQDEVDQQNGLKLPLKVSQTQKLLPLGGLGMDFEEAVNGTSANGGEPEDRGEGPSHQEAGEVRVKKHGSEPPTDELTGLDEEELDRFILTPDEVRIKERVWMEFNKDWLEATLKKQLKLEHDQKNGVPIREPYKRKKPKAPRDASTAMHNSAAESAKMMFKQKQFSKKINYDALNSLFPGASSKMAGKKRAKGKRGRQMSSDEDEDDDDDEDEEEQQRAAAKKKGKRQQQQVPATSGGESTADPGTEIEDEDAQILPYQAAEQADNSYFDDDAGDDYWD